GLPSPLWPSSQLAIGLSPLAPRSGLERSDFVRWHDRDGQGGAKLVCFAPAIRTSTCSAIARATSTSIPRYLTVLSILVCPNSSCTARRCDECRLGTPKRMGTEKVRVEADHGNPGRDKRSILSGGDTAVMVATPAEEKFARFLVRGLDVVVNGLPRLLR